MKVQVHPQEEGRSRRSTNPRRLESLCPLSMRPPSTKDPEPKMLGPPPIAMEACVGAINGAPPPMLKVSLIVRGERVPKM
jgi:hypothetical protein